MLKKITNKTNNAAVFQDNAAFPVPCRAGLAYGLYLELFESSGFCAEKMTVKSNRDHSGFHRLRDFLRCQITVTKLLFRYGSFYTACLKLRPQTVSF